MSFQLGNKTRSTEFFIDKNQVIYCPLIDLYVSNKLDTSISPGTALITISIAVYGDNYLLSTF